MSVDSRHEVYCVSTLAVQDSMFSDAQVTQVMQARDEIARRLPWTCKSGRCQLPYLDRMLSQ